MRAWRAQTKKEIAAAFRPPQQRGAASIEYAILGSLIAAVIVLVVTTLGAQVRTLFETVMQGW